MGGVIHVNFPMLAMAASNLKARSGNFVTHMGDADQACGPLKQSWGESDSEAAERYQASWAKIVSGAVELSQTIDRLGRAVSKAQVAQQAQEKNFANQFPA